MTGNKCPGGTCLEEGGVLSCQPGGTISSEKGKSNMPLEFVFM